MYDFTSYIIESVTDSVPDAIIVPAGHVTRPYLAAGYMGGWYWGVFPQVSTLAEAEEAFDTPFQTLERVGFFPRGLYASPELNR